MEVKAQVITKQYGDHFNGEVISVDEKEISRVPHALKKVSDFEAAQAAQVPIDKDAQALKNSIQGMKELAQQSKDILTKRYKETQAEITEAVAEAVVSKQAKKLKI